jgi:hypothetical protein
VTTQPDINLDASHVYRVGGLVVPGVTSVLGQVDTLGGIPAAALEYARERGVAVHLATQLHDEGDLDWSSLDETIEPYVLAWVQFLKDTEFEVTEIEKLVYSDRHRYCGTLDRKGLLYGEPTVLDIKCVAVLSPVTGLQTAAYAEADRPNQRTKAARRAAVQLKPDGTYRWQEYTEKTDFSVFLSLLQLANWRATHLKETYHD